MKKVDTPSRFSSMTRALETASASPFRKWSGDTVGEKATSGVNRARRDLKSNFVKQNGCGVCYYFIFS
jgi:ubiquinone biosynthesis protein UbiJ